MSLKISAIVKCKVSVSDTRIDMVVEDKVLYRGHMYLRGTTVRSRYETKRKALQHWSYTRFNDDGSMTAIYNNTDSKGKAGAIAFLKAAVKKRIARTNPTAKVLFAIENL